MQAYVLIKVCAGELKDVVLTLRKVEGVIEAHMTFGLYDANEFNYTPRGHKLRFLLSKNPQSMPAFGIQSTQFHIRRLTHGADSIHS